MLLETPKQITDLDILEFLEYFGIYCICRLAELRSGGRCRGVHLYEVCIYGYLVAYKSSLKIANPGYVFNVQ